MPRWLRGWRWRIRTEISAKRKNASPFSTGVIERGLPSGLSQLDPLLELVFPLLSAVNCLEDA